MALDMHLNFEGGDIKIEGTSKHAKHAKEIQILAWSWGASQSGSFAMGEGGAGAGKANIQDLSFTKYLDKTSPLLLKGVTTGAHLDKATLSMSKAGGEQADFLKIILESVMVTSYSTGGSGGEDMITENVTLTFAKISFEHYKQDKTGAVAQTAATFYDVTEVKAG